MASWCICLWRHMRKTQGYYNYYPSGKHARYCTVLSLPLFGPRSSLAAETSDLPVGTRDPAAPRPGWNPSYLEQRISIVS